MAGRYRWVVAALLFVAGMLNYLDRAALSVAAPFIKSDLKLGAADMGVLFSSFFIGYCVFCFVGGYASDRIGPKRVFGLAAGLWSIFCGATAFVTGFGQLIFFRILFGIGEGPMGSTTNKTINNWFPRREAGRVVGLTNAGQPLGGAIAAPIVGLVAVASRRHRRLRSFARESVRPHRTGAHRLYHPVWRRVPCGVSAGCFDGRARYGRGADRDSWTPAAFEDRYRIFRRGQRNVARTVSSPTQST
jgi:MFS family permease